MATARIYRPSKPATQSGLARSKGWVLEYEPLSPQRNDPLMGWTGAGDTRGQVRLSFPTREDAIAHAERIGVEYVVDAPPKRVMRPKSYAANFAYNRTQPWTH